MAGEEEEALAEFDFLVSEAAEGAGEAQSHGDGPEWGKICLHNCFFWPFTNIFTPFFTFRVTCYIVLYYSAMIANFFSDENLQNILYFCSKHKFLVCIRTAS